MLVNLVGNAIKFTPTGRVSVRARSLARNAENVTLALEVLDTGIGVAPDKQAQLFERFFQGDQGDTRTFEGAGIGLSLARDLVALHGGEIGVQSEPGEGSRFWFTAVGSENPSLAPTVAMP